MDETKHTKTLDFRDKQEKVISVIKREFQNEINKRQEEVHLIQKRLLKAKKSLHLLKYVVIKSFYDTKELNLTNKDESNPHLEHQTAGIQNRIHPAVKKILGKTPLNFDSPTARSKEKLQTNDEQEILSENKTNLLPLIYNQQTVTNSNVQNEENIPRGNQNKTKHEIIVGNISKYSPSNSAQDISSHKWMIYVRGPRNNPDISHIVKKVRFFLHPSYQPNDVIEIEESPFHLSRRGWGEFPVRVQIHFQYSFNKPIDVIHHLKLDQTRSGRQTLGNETLLNVWLHNNSDIQEEEDDEVIQPIKRIKQEQDNFYSKPSCSKDIQETELNIIHNDSTFQVIKEEPISDIDLVFNPRIESDDDSEDDTSDTESRIYRDPDTVYDENRTYLVDHCYTDDIIHENCFKNMRQYAITIPLDRFKTTRQIVFYLFKLLPLVTDSAADLTYICCYPYVAASVKEFTSWNIGKQRCSEWYRAKEIKELLILHNIPDQKLWTIKFIIMFGRAHLFTPNADYKIFYSKKEAFKTIPNEGSGLKVHSTFTEFMPISQLMENVNTRVDENLDHCVLDVENIDSDESMEVQENDISSKDVSSETDYVLNPLCTYVKQCAKEIDITLEDEEIIPNVLHNTGERVLLKAVMCLAEELIRTAWANKVVGNKGRNLDYTLGRDDVYQVLLEREEFDIFTNDGLGKNMNV